VSPASGFNDAAHSDFWRASPQGLMYLLRGYDEDAMQRVPPGSSLELILPVWRVGEIVLHAEQLAAALGEGETTVILHFQWEGLAGRRLRSLNGRRHLWDAARHSEIRNLSPDSDD
jgi:hypothetical protein